MIDPDQPERLSIAPRLDATSSLYLPACQATKSPGASEDGEAAVRARHAQYRHLHAVGARLHWLPRPELGARVEHHRGEEAALAKRTLEELAGVVDRLRAAAERHRRRHGRSVGLLVLDPVEETHETF